MEEATRRPPMTVQEFAKAVRVTPRTVVNWCNDKKIRAYRVGYTWRIKPEELERIEAGGWGSTEEVTP